MSYLLFLNGARSWHENLIFFFPHDVEEILRLHIPSSGKGDFVVWHLKKSDFFSAKKYLQPCFKPKGEEEGYRSV